MEWSQIMKKAWYNNLRYERIAIKVEVNVANIFFYITL